jgi:hypothetical protein
MTRLSIVASTRLRRPGVAVLDFRALQFDFGADDQARAARLVVFGRFGTCTAGLLGRRAGGRFSVDGTEGAGTIAYFGRASVSLRGERGVLLNMEVPRWGWDGNPERWLAICVPSPVGPDRASLGGTDAALSVGKKRQVIGIRWRVAHLMAPALSLKSDLFLIR